MIFVKREFMSEFTEYLSEVSNSFKGTFTSSDLMGRFKLGDKKFREIVALLIEEIVENGKIKLFSPGKNKSGDSIYMGWKYFEIKLMENFSNAKSILDENETYGIFEKITGCKEPEMKNVLKFIENYTSMIRFDERSRSGPVMLNLYRFILPSQEVFVTQDTMNLMYVRPFGDESKEEKPSFFSKRKKSVSSGVTSTDMVKTAFSLMFEDLGQIVILKDELFDSPSFRRYFANIDLKRTFDEILKSVYDYGVTIDERLISLFPENWLDIENISRQIDKIESGEKESVIKNMLMQYSFVNEKETETLIKYFLTPARGKNLLESFSVNYGQQLDDKGETIFESETPWNLEDEAIKSPKFEESQQKNSGDSAVFENIFKSETPENLEMEEETNENSEFTESQQEVSGDPVVFEIKDSEDRVGISGREIYTPEEELSFGNDNLNNYPDYKEINSAETSDSDELSDESDGTGKRLYDDYAGETSAVEKNASVKGDTYFTELENSGNDIVFSEKGTHSEIENTDVPEGKNKPSSDEDLNFLIDDASYKSQMHKDEEEYDIAGASSSSVSELNEHAELLSDDFNMIKEGTNSFAEGTNSVTEKEAEPADFKFKANIPVDGGIETTETEYTDRLYDFIDDADRENRFLLIRILDALSIDEGYYDMDILCIDTAEKLSETGVFVYKDMDSFVRIFRNSNLSYDYFMDLKDKLNDKIMSEEEKRRITGANKNTGGETDIDDIKSLCGKSITFITVDEDLRDKVERIGMEIGFEIFDGLAYKPDFAVFDKESEYLVPIAKNSEIPVMDFLKFKKMLNLQR